MTLSGVVFLALFILGPIVLALMIWCMIVVIDAARQASEYYGRENERYRRAYEQHRRDTS